jgi:hypothetical protein
LTEPHQLTFRRLRKKLASLPAADDTVNLPH